MRPRPKYKQLYLQEKRRREFYEQCEPRLKVRWEKRETRVAELCRDTMQAMRACATAPYDAAPRKMKGLSGWVTTNAEEIP